MFVTILTCLSSFMISGCSTVTTLFGDRFVYHVQGVIVDHSLGINASGNTNTGTLDKVSFVKVAMLCADKELSKTMSDTNGYFILEGYGGGDDCKLILEHPEYMRKLFWLDPKHREDPEYELNWTWIVNVGLEQKE